MAVGLKIRVVTDPTGIRVQYVPSTNTTRGRAVRDVAAVTDETAVKVQIIPGSGDPACLQWAKVDVSGNPI